MQPLSLSILPLLSWGVEEMVGEKMDGAKAYAFHKAATLMEVPKAYVEMATAGIAFGFELFVAVRVKKNLDHAKDEVWRGFFIRIQMITWGIPMFIIFVK